MDTKGLARCCSQARSGALHPSDRTARTAARSGHTTLSDQVEPFGRWSARLLRFTESALAPLHLQRSSGRCPLRFHVQRDRLHVLGGTTAIACVASRSQGQTDPVKPDRLQQNWPLEPKCGCKRV
eukprot:5579499-Amphidinium_carterae.1